MSQSVPFDKMLVLGESQTTYIVLDYIVKYITMCIPYRIPLIKYMKYINNI